MKKTKHGWTIECKAEMHNTTRTVYAAVANEQAELMNQIPQHTWPVEVDSTQSRWVHSLWKKTKEPWRRKEMPCRYIYLLLPGSLLRLVVGERLKSDRGVIEERLRSDTGGGVLASSKPSQS